MKKRIFLLLGAVLVVGLYLGYSRAEVNDSTAFYLSFVDKDGDEKTFEVKREELPKIDEIIVQRSKDFFQKEENIFVIRLNEGEFPALKKIFDNKLLQERKKAQELEGDTFVLKYDGETFPISLQAVKLSQYLENLALASCDDDQGEQACEFSLGAMEKVLSRKGIGSKHVKILVNLASATSKNDEVYKTLADLDKESLFLLVQLADALGASKLVGAENKVLFDPERDLLSELLDDLINKVETKDLEAFLEEEENGVLSKVLRLPQVVFLLRQKRFSLFGEKISLDLTRLTGEAEELLLLGNRLFIEDRDLVLWEINLDSGRISGPNDCLKAFGKEMRSFLNLGPSDPKIYLEYIGQPKVCGLSTGEIWGAAKLSKYELCSFLPENRMICFDDSIGARYRLSWIDIKLYEREKIENLGSISDFSRNGLFIAALDYNGITILNWKSGFKEEKKITENYEGTFSSVTLLPDHKIAYHLITAQLDWTVVYDWREGKELLLVKWEDEFKDWGRWAERWSHVQSLLWLPGQEKIAILCTRNNEWLLILWDVFKAILWKDIFKKIDDEQENWEFELLKLDD